MARGVTLATRLWLRNAMFRARLVRRLLVASTKSLATDSDLPTISPTRWCTRHSVDGARGVAGGAGWLQTCAVGLARGCQ